MELRERRATSSHYELRWMALKAQGMVGLVQGKEYTHLELELVERLVMDLLWQQCHSQAGSFDARVEERRGSEADGLPVSRRLF